MLWGINTRLSYHIRNMNTYINTQFSYVMHQWNNLVYEVRILHPRRALSTFRSIVAFSNPLGLPNDTYAYRARAVLPNSRMRKQRADELPKMTALAKGCIPTKSRVFCLFVFDSLSIKLSSLTPSLPPNPSKAICWMNAVGYFEASAFRQGEKELQNGSEAPSFC